MNHSQISDSWNQEIIFNDGDDFFNDLLSAIQNCKRTIKIETYIFDLDILGKRILHSLTQAAERGIIVKLLIDGAGCSEWDYKTAEKFRSNNFEIQFFHPLPWQRKHSQLWKFLNINKIMRGLSLFNHRNHRKVFLIDDTAYLGSMNVSARHLKSITHQFAWRDTMVKITGKNLHVLHESFNETWKYFNNYILRYLSKNIATSGMPLLMMNRTLRQRRNSYKNLINRIKSAKQFIYITNPYFVPNFRIRKILKNAVKNGVKVKIILPSKSDFIGVKLAMEGIYSYLLSSGIKIFEYQPSMVHAKTLITDHRVMIGSTNLNYRSLLFDLEVDVEITHSENIQITINQFNEDLSKTKEIIFDEWKKRPFLNKLFEKMFLIIRMVL